ncbi:MAG: DUF3795 domain-containing protein [Proteobacteria bacterium]|nr:DUF3795 domain-containing protein [Pseudomonadota bacterium]
MRKPKYLWNPQFCQPVFSAFPALEYSQDDGCGELPCEIKKCVESKAIEGCWKCSEFESCNKMDFLKPFCGEAPVKNLRKIKTYGLNNWVTHREKQYPWH